MRRFTSKTYIVKNLREQLTEYCQLTFIKLFTICVSYQTFTVLNFNVLCRQLSVSICHFLSEGIANPLLSGWYLKLW